MTSTSIHDELAQAAASPSEGRRAAADKAPGPVATAFAELSDRNDLLEHQIEQLAGLVDDLTVRLSPVLPDLPTGTVGPSEAPATPAQVDTRGQVARSISAQARRVDLGAQRVSAIGMRVGGLLEALEV